MFQKTASFMSISGRLLQITIIRAKRFLSSCNSTVSPVHETLIFLAMDFQACSFCFFMVVHRLFLPDWLRSLTKVSKSFWPMSLCPTRSFWTFSGTTTFVTRLKVKMLCLHSCWQPSCRRETLGKSQDMTRVASAFPLDKEGSFWHNLDGRVRRNTL